MPEVSVDNNPSITDTVLFTLYTPDENGCFLKMPYKVNKIIIYFVERNFSSGKTSEYTDVIYDVKKLAVAEAAEAAACVDPTSEKIAAAKLLREQAESNVKKEDFYFNEATPIQISGTVQYPAWITGTPITLISAANPTVITSIAHGLNTGDTVYIYNTNSTPAIDGEYTVTKITNDTFSVPYDLSCGSCLSGNDGFWYTAFDESNNLITPIIVNGKTSIGEFEYVWQPKGAREGDYFICWTWTTLPGGNPISSHKKFSLAGDTQLTTSIPSHFTNPIKYKTLLERYTPEMFKMYISDNDVTPNILNKFNESIAMGFTTLENLANQIVDLQSPNSLHESLIPYLSNFFNLKLKTGDPTRWRGQMVRAIPMFKSKGTRRELNEAFEHAAMHLTRLKQLWQVVSKYTWQESFAYETSYDFILEKQIIQPINTNNLSIWIRPSDSEEYIQLIPDMAHTYSDYVSFVTVDGVTTMSWTSTILDLIEGDIIRVLYQYQTVLNPTEQSLDEYIRLLPLLDTRDERLQSYPKKNWNIRGIEDDDVLFDLIVQSKHPFHDFLIFGKIRTEFPYSENIYNMEEYNGSIRSSKVPCDIDKNFMDPCSSCISSSFNLDVEVESLSDDRILEFYEVFKENAPFHAVLNTINFIGGWNEFIASPVEEINAYITVKFEQLLISGDGQMYFNRAMRLSNLNNLPLSECVFRDELSDIETKATGVSGVAYNNDVVLYCPASKLGGIGIRNDGSSVLEILDGIYAGTYNIDKAEGSSIFFQTSPAEPIQNCNRIFESSGALSNCAFPFRVSDPIIDNTNYVSLCNISQDNFIVFGDANKDFVTMGVESQFDVDQGTALSAWTVLIPVYSGAIKYTILNIDQNGNLILAYDSTLPSSSATGLSYTIYKDVNPIDTGASGFISVTNRARITALNPNILPISSLINEENYYQTIGVNDYLIISLVDGTDDQFYISNYSGGDVNGANLIVSKRVIDGKIGYMSYRGLNLKLSGNYETILGIQNGSNPVLTPVLNDDFKENFVIEIGTDKYWINTIDGNSPIGFTTISLSGPDNYWKTLANSGTNVTLNIYKFTIKGATIMGQQFDQPEHTFRVLSRSGSPNIVGSEEDGTIVTSLAAKDDGINDFIKQNENISYKIQYSNGTEEKGEL